ncbi:Transmembrane protein 65 [Aphelenchoides avenae]|nr:Transmembrane protein 65 [Aphelenchus avenae]
MRRAVLIDQLVSMVAGRQRCASSAAKKELVHFHSSDVHFWGNKPCRPCPHRQQRVRDGSRQPPATQGARAASRRSQREELAGGRGGRVRYGRSANLTYGNANSDQPSVVQLKQLFAYNAIPFIGFGILDNMIMILAGEYIDQSLGALLAISTMAAAALGNIISDVAGVGLAHYVEKLAGKLGIRHPVLTAAQLESSRARVTVNLARAFGLVIGCLIGMFPLLFF